MIRASFKIFSGRGNELLDASVSGNSINSAFVNIKKKIMEVRTKARLTKEDDPLRNWSQIEIFVNKGKGHLPPKKEIADAE